MAMAAKELFSAGCFKEAQEAYEAELGPSPSASDASRIYANIALCHLKMNQPDEAVLAADMSLKADRTNSKARFHRARGHELAGRSLKALADFSLLSEPEARKHRNRLERLLKHAGGVLARVETISCSALVPGQGDFLHLLGTAAKTDTVEPGRVHNIPELSDPDFDQKVFLSPFDSLLKGAQFDLQAVMEPVAQRMTNNIERHTPMVLGDVDRRQVCGLLVDVFHKNGAWAFLEEFEGVVCELDRACGNPWRYLLCGLAHLDILVCFEDRLRIFRAFLDLVMKPVWALGSVLTTQLQRYFQTVFPILFKGYMCNMFCHHVLVMPAQRQILPEAIVQQCWELAQRIGKEEDDAFNLSRYVMRKIRCDEVGVAPMPADAIWRSTWSAINTVAEFSRQPCSARWFLDAIEDPAAWLEALAAIPGPLLQSLLEYLRGVGLPRRFRDQDTIELLTDFGGVSAGSILTVLEGNKGILRAMEQVEPSGSIAVGQLCTASLGGGTFIDVQITGQAEGDTFTASEQGSNLLGLQVLKPLPCAVSRHVLRRMILINQHREGVTFTRSGTLKKGPSSLQLTTSSEEILGAFLKLAAKHSGAATGAAELRSACEAATNMAAELETLIPRRLVQSPPAIQQAVDILLAVGTSDMAQKVVQDLRERVGQGAEATGELLQELVLAAKQAPVGSLAVGASAAAPLPATASALSACELTEPLSTAGGDPPISDAADAGLGATELPDQVLQTLQTYVTPALEGIPLRESTTAALNSPCLAKRIVVAIEAIDEPYDVDVLLPPLLLPAKCKVDADQRRRSAVVHWLELLDEFPALTSKEWLESLVDASVLQSIADWQKHFGNNASFLRQFLKSIGRCASEREPSDGPALIEEAGHIATCMAPVHGWVASLPLSTESVDWLLSRRSNWLTLAPALQTLWNDLEALSFRNDPTTWRLSMFQTALKLIDETSPDIDGAIDAFADVIRAAKDKAFGGEATNAFAWLAASVKVWRDVAGMKDFAEELGKLSTREEFLVLCAAAQQVGPELVGPAMDFLREAEAARGYDWRNRDERLDETLLLCARFRAKRYMHMCREVMDSAEQHGGCKVGLVAQALLAVTTGHIFPDLSSGNVQPLIADVLAHRDEQLLDVFRQSLGQIASAVGGAAEDATVSLIEDASQQLHLLKVATWSRIGAQHGLGDASICGLEGSCGWMQPFCRSTLLFLEGAGSRDPRLVDALVRLLRCLARWWVGSLAFRVEEVALAGAQAVAMAVAADSLVTTMETSRRRQSSPQLDHENLCPTPTVLLSFSDAFRFNKCRHSNLEGSPWHVSQAAAQRLPPAPGRESSGLDENKGLTEDEESKVEAALLSQFFASLSIRMVRYIPFQLPSLAGRVFFRGLGDRDGKDLSMTAVADFLMHGLSAADLTKANPLGMSSSRSGQIFLTHNLPTACLYLSKHFRDGALVAIDGSFIDKAVRQGEYRLEKEVVLQLALHGSVPLTAVVAAFLPESMEADLTRLRDGSHALESDGLKALSVDELERIAIALKQGTPCLFDRLHFYSDELYSGLPGFVTSVLKAVGRSVDSSTGIDAVLQCAQQLQEARKAHSVEVIRSTAAVLEPLIPVQCSSAQQWLGACFSGLADDRFCLVYPFLETCLPNVIRMLDLLPKRIRTSTRMLWRSLDPGLIGARPDFSKCAENTRNAEKTQPSILGAVRMVYACRRGGKQVLATDECTGDVRALARALAIVASLLDTQALGDLPESTLTVATTSLEAALALEPGLLAAGVKALGSAVQTPSSTPAAPSAHNVQIDDARVWMAVWRVLWAYVAAASLGAWLEIEPLRASMECADGETWSPDLTRQLLEAARAHVWKEDFREALDIRS